MIANDRSSSHEHGADVADAAPPADAPTVQLKVVELATGTAGDGDPVAAVGEPQAGPTETADFDQRNPGSPGMLPGEDPAEALATLARVAAELWLRTTAWGVDSSLRAGARLAHAATDSHVAGELYEDLARGARAYAREFLGITELDEQVRQLAPLAGATIPHDDRDLEAFLREQGELLLHEAADVNFDDGPHPAYARILTELAPDEARVLRTLATDGPQPMVDIRETNLIGIGSQLIAPGLNMLGAQAGLRHRDRVEMYLGNLLRLGLVERSDDAVADTIAYQVLEAQPEVLATIKDTPRAKTIHRSIRLTAFGKAFCDLCLPAAQVP